MKPYVPLTLEENHGDVRGVYPSFCPNHVSAWPQSRNLLPCRVSASDGSGVPRKSTNRESGWAPVISFFKSLWQAGACVRTCMRTHTRIHLTSSPLPYSARDPGLDQRAPHLNLCGAVEWASSLTASVTALGHGVEPRLLAPEALLILGARRPLRRGIAALC